MHQRVALDPFHSETIDPSAVFARHLGLFAFPRGAHLTERTKPLGEWLAQRTALNTWPYSRCLEGPPATETRITSQNDRPVQGINFGSQDYLGLASHPALRDAAFRALEEFGPHAASSPMLQGNTALSRRLEMALAERLGMEHVLLFPTGWAAGFGVIAGLVRPNDHILIDQLAHACLMQGARAATPNHTFFRHNCVEDVRRRLAKIRTRDTQNAILVITEGLFSMDSDSPDLPALQEVCREHGAVLMVDVAHDFGATGPGGAGQVGLQGMLGQVDLVMGSFSKTLASNGGFVATRDLSVKQYLGVYGGPHIYSNALSPVAAGVVLEALRIVCSAEGDALRNRALDNILRLRRGFAAKGIECLGNPSNIVPVITGDETLAKWTGRLLEEHGLLANLVEFPAVPRGRSRFRFQVMASHSGRQVDAAVEIFSRCLAQAREIAGTAGAAPETVRLVVAL
ncbi:MAG TPA: pyridoxal phosphate-dependent aminotransferase family protein [Thermoanaerobaculia bacterium]|nr:pyridoxal phosphate-dependent aminotransferase family protein [Thermoanaerobaculia bacterium]